MPQMYMGLGPTTEDDTNTCYRYEVCVSHLACHQLAEECGDVAEGIQVTCFRTLQYCVYHQACAHILQHNATLGVAASADNIYKRADSNSSIKRMSCGTSQLDKNETRTPISGSSGTSGSMEFCRDYPSLIHQSAVQTCVPF